MKNDITSFDLQQLGYKEVSQVDEELVEKWDMVVLGFWAKDENNREHRYYISYNDLMLRICHLTGTLPANVIPKVVT